MPTAAPPTVKVTPTRHAATSSSREIRFPTVTGDGVIVAKEIELQDSLNKARRWCARSPNTSDAGDGTTTATVRRGDLPRGHQERHGRREPDGAQAR